MNEETIKEIEKNDETYQMIVEELKKLSYNYSYRGTKYLAIAIYLLNKKKKNNLERDIYPIIANIYGKTAHNIKCNITNATSNMYMDCREEVIEKYFGVMLKPTPKYVIYEIMKKLNLSTTF